MTLHLLTIVLDGEPWIRRHLPEFERLPFPWMWHVVEGAAMNRHCTSWCNAQKPRISSDGTTKYLDTIAHHPKVRLHRRTQWDGKIEMVNTPLADIREECVLMQLDSDELWHAEQLESVVRAFDICRDVGSMQFRCNYFVGPNIAAVTDGCYGNRGDEWMRAWRFRPGMKFISHEPPVMAGTRGRMMTRKDTAALGMVFDHMAYVSEKQVAAKGAFYGYRDAVKHWRRLQENKVWPARLGSFLPWVHDEAMADLVK